MNVKLKYLGLVLLLGITGCEQSGRLDGFLRPVPVEPLTDILATALPVGYCTAVAMADQRTYPIPHERWPAGNGFTLIRVLPSEAYPLIYLDRSIQEVWILRFSVDDETALLSIFFKPGADLPGRILEIQNVPAILEDGQIRSVIASQDVRVRDSLEINLQMGPGNIQIELDKLASPRPETTSAAIEQNAWIVEVDPSGTWDYFEDDRYTITGGLQDVSTMSDRTGTGTSVLQLAMMEILITPECLLAPTDGFAVLQEVAVETSQEGQTEDLVLGSVFYRFVPRCTGTVNIPLATGNFIAATGQDVPLHLLE